MVPTTPFGQTIMEMGLLLVEAKLLVLPDLCKTAAHALSQQVLTALQACGINNSSHCHI